MINLSNPITLVVVILALCIVCTLLLFWLIPWAAKKGLPVGQWFSTANGTIAGAEVVLKAIDTDPLKTSTPELILKCAKAAVYYAEQLWKTGQLTKEERKTEAVNYVVLALKEAGITPTENQMVLIKGAIDSAVGVMNETKLLAASVTPQTVYREYDVEAHC